MDSATIHDGYAPGAVGRLTALHATYYGDLWELDTAFEAEIAEGIAEFVDRYDPSKDGLWLVLDDTDQVRGGIIIDSRDIQTEGAQLRYFILDPEFQGQGLGRELLNRAMEFCHEHAYERVFLWTVDELEAAISLYEDVGFEATETIDIHTGWQTEVPYRLFEYTRDY
ncbi:GNAT family N-acetyltransferase [Halorubrum aethiopicum]|uniref:GNAT family N-acetyltransferase n=1 Tax=Halorubrum aethiopicum TaxID=1758255 RepID=UPI000832B462|nr:GNAT family N-acetyltransferase [Halorubrum aethiopicum]